MTAVLPLPTRDGRHPGTPRVLVISGSVGAGHDGAARELADRLRAQGVAVDVRDFLDAVPHAIAVTLRQGYATTVDHVPAAFEWLFRHLEFRGPVWRIMRWICGLAEDTVRGWLAGGYDAVVSTYPLASQTLGEFRARGICTAPVLTYLTDPAAHHSWVHPAVDRHVTVTAATARQGAADYGVAMTAGGPLVPARFARPAPAGELARVAAELGLDGVTPVALLVTGSLGLGDALPTVADVAAAGVVPLVLCGRNEGLRARVAAVPGAVALGWRTDVHVLLQLADVIVHNAGGLSFTEALVAGVPAVTYRAIPGHGRANAAVLERAGLAPWARDRDELAGLLHRQIAAGRRQPRLGDPTTQVLDLLPFVPAATAA